MPGKPAGVMVVAIFGPTAAGKSRVAAAVARELGGEVISADSMQVYRGLAVLTDQPRGSDIREVPHHLVGKVPLAEEYSAARFAGEAAKAISEVTERRNLPLLVGGTGLYIRGLLGGFSFAGRAGEPVRQRWQEFFENEGMEAAVCELERLDPQAASVVDKDNPRRLLRALEAAAGPGPSIAAERSRLWSPESKYRVLCFGLDLPRDELYRGIEGRVDAMLSGGAVEEVAEALKGGVSRTASQAIGFNEIQKYLEGQLTLPEAAAAIKQKSRRYAKRQLTWMRNMPDTVRIGLAESDYEAAAASIIEQIQAVYAV